LSIQPLNFALGFSLFRNIFPNGGNGTKNVENNGKSSIENKSNSAASPQNTQSISSGTPNRGITITIQGNTSSTRTPSNGNSTNTTTKPPVKNPPWTSIFGNQFSRNNVQTKPEPKTIPQILNQITQEKPPTTTNTSSTSSSTQVTTKPLSEYNLPFDVSTLSPGEAYARLVRLDNNEQMVTSREQKIATELFAANVYKETAVPGHPNITFLSNPSSPATNEAKAQQELEIMAKMPNFKPLFDRLSASGEKVIVMVSSYGSGFAASNISLTDKNGKPLNVITIDPNAVDYTHANRYKRNVLSALSNELQEIDSKIAERQQNTNYVTTRPFQEATLAVDQVMETFIADFSSMNKVSFAGLSPSERSSTLALMQNWSAEALQYNINQAISDTNRSSGYASFPPITSLQAAQKAAGELNQKLGYLLGSTAKVRFVPKQSSNGGYSFEAVIK
jgi:hypothetical protein